MLAVPLQQRLSIEDFFVLANNPPYSDSIVELVDGVIVEMTKPGFQHGVITNHLAFLLTTHAIQNKVGIVTAAETGYIVAENTVRGVDIGFVSYQRLPTQPLQKHFPGAPDLAVEIISPSNEALDIHRKIRELLKAGARQVWIVYPDTRSVDVWTVGGAQTLESDDTLDGGDVLPGFKLSVAAIFAV